MNIADEIQKLQDLHRRGTLTSEEFATAKAAVLAKASGGTDPSQDPDLQSHLEEIKFQNQVAQLDREWELERDQYAIAGRYGQRYIPTKGQSLVGGMIAVLLGCIWTATAASMNVFGLFPLFGMVFILFGIAISYSGYRKADQYQKAYQAYRDRREKLLAEQMQPAHPAGSESSNESEEEMTARFDGETTKCLKCGQKMASQNTKCFHCGWSYV